MLCFLFNYLRASFFGLPFPSCLLSSLPTLLFIVQVLICFSFIYLFFCVCVILFEFESSLVQKNALLLDKYLKCLHLYLDHYAVWIFGCVKKDKTNSKFFGSYHAYYIYMYVFLIHAHIYTQYAVCMCVYILLRPSWRYFNAISISSMYRVCFKCLFIPSIFRFYISSCKFQSWFYNIYVYQASSNLYVILGYPRF